MKKIVSVLLIALLAVPALAQDAGEGLSAGAPLTFVGDRGAGNVIWDEAIDGDLGDRVTPTPVTLESMLDVVTGTVGGTGADFDDCFTFDVPVGNSVSTIVLENYIAAGGNTTSGFQLYTGVPPDGTAFGDLVDQPVGPPDVGSDLLGAAGPLSGGQFTACLLEGTPGQVFALSLGSDIQGLPDTEAVPTMSAWGLGLLMLLMAAVTFVVIRRS